ncbi:putative cation chloride cotransporter [Aspergillus ruber CBS 135680]|uniref:Putative cation chloride cotransporter n=1 Tax=Aspergillus ruber (strain CBS 135680) TaxID=1388766 RepID=A0A017SE31_ASPRC|nr:putative cation chloride cotransporter [Aspergillus ruber CBS 135680]EYE94894.1 putative cation chloride cotransporter [Aspergillus ruber CBS 135680]
MSRRTPNFSTRTPEEDVSRLAPSDSAHASPEESSGFLQSWRHRLSFRPYEPLNSSSSRPSNRQRHSLPSNFFSSLFRWWDKRDNGEGEGQERARSHLSLSAGPLRESSRDRSKAQSRPKVEGSDKLGTFSGVFVPTTLNVLSILMFLRFGFILGQAGLLGILGLLLVSYTINLVTTMSLSAIATNGTVKGGGAYYLISRSLGPEFGGSIGIVFYLGYVLNTGMNAVGLVDCFAQNFGAESGTWGNFLQEGFWWEYLWGTVVLILCTGICLAGSSIFSRASNGLLVVLLVATFSIPVSVLVMQPFSVPRLGIEFTGLSLRTLMENLKPRFTKHAAGSQIPGRENFQDLFGILFPATGGIFAGASMSGDLRNPSRSIPSGTLSGLALTFITYTLVILAMAASITRASLYNNANVMQVVNLSGVVILLGEFATSFFSSLMGVIGSAKLLQAIARDSLLPGLSIFSQGTKKHDEPIYAIVMTYVVAQLTMLFDINQIASFVTMTYLMTFLVTNLACFLLKIGSAPNFRPSFHYFNWQTAAAGTLVSGISMFFVDGLYAGGCVGILALLFLLIHYNSPPKPWGDVSQSLIYHQVRKYLLRLRQEHVKFWRPQILLFVSNIDDQEKMVSFCNSLKKGALFVLGHVLVTEDFTAAVPEARRQQSTWTKFVESSKVKAFVNMAVSPSAEWGIRNVVLNAGLGGMRPNIVIIDQFRRGQSLVETLNANREEPGMSCKSYVTVLDDLLFKLRINVAVAKGFEHLEFPRADGQNTKRYIDLWPIQMSAALGADSESKRNVLTTNFDTYTLILQLGCILNTVPSWKKSYKLRVSVFVEYETDVEDERIRVEALLEKLRIEAEVMVFWLACGDSKMYRAIVNGDKSPGMEKAREKAHEVLKDEEWWQEIQRIRRSARVQRGSGPNRPGRVSSWHPSSHDGGSKVQNPKIGGLKRFIKSSDGRRRSISSFRTTGNVNFGMQTHHLLDALVDYDITDITSDSSDSSSSDSDESTFEPYVDDPGSGSDGDYDDDNRRDEADSNTMTGVQAPRILSPSQSALSPGTVSLGGEDEASDAAGPSMVSVIPPSEEGSFTPRSQAPPVRPKPSRSPSSNRFSSSPIPEPRVNADETGGPSIMFAANSPPPRSSPESKADSIYTRHLCVPGSAPAEPAEPASGYPSQAAVPLSFNDLPSRAQHLILNELMIQQSAETAVVFTTLPSPSDGTSHSEEASESYLSDLDVLWQGLPPCLLVHSNSMTVTMNL